MSQSEPHSARDRILVAASTLFCRHGFSSTGVDTVIERAGTAKATLYKHFASKQDLIEAVLEAEGAAWRSWFFGKLARIQAPADKRMLAVFDVLEEWFADPGFYGCPFINAVAEFETGNDAVRQAAEKHKAHLMTWLTAQAIELELPDVKEVARSFAVLIDGAIVAAQHTRDPSFARTARVLAEQLLDRTIPH
ncbi:TetR/AcrR family transcriptional regulator [Salipiger abyssi]|uniref:Transcriptional regulator n=1 Tax=Salipiger abyssi TaxID=1250539 RepID=A0A1P8UTY9_9RHOB|nr:TetR/AcrR family transcriptional regulator [Salipiger abyssi]APZ52863.1 transcriptional regulator [Salipiger abyssi]